MRTRATTVAWMLGAMLLTTPATSAPITGFEAGDPAPDATSGDALTIGSVLGIGPTEGTQQFALTTRDGFGAVDDLQTEIDMGLAAGTIDGIFSNYLESPNGPSTGTDVFTGSAFQITFTANAGDTLMFDYNFLTTEAVPETTYSDFLWGVLELGGVGTVADGVLNHAAQPATDFSPTSNAAWQQTGYTTLNFLIGTGGTYTLTLGVHDVEDGVVDTAALFDWFRILPAPEPGTFGMLATGLLMLNAVSRRQRRS